MGKQTLCCGGMELSFDVRSVTDSPDIWICVAFFCYDVKVLVSEKARDNHMCQLRFPANQHGCGPLCLIMFLKRINRLDKRIRS